MAIHVMKKNMGTSDKESHYIRRLDRAGLSEKVPFLLRSQ